MRFAASISFMFTERPFLERFDAAARAGFTGVEIQMLPDINIRRIARAAQDAGIEVSLLNVGMGDLLDGGLGLSGVPGREKSFAAALAQAAEAADQLNARHLHVGPSRIPPGQRRELCLDVYRTNLAMVVREAEALAGRTQLVIEAMNRQEMPDALFADIGQVIELLNGEPSIGLLFDIYHVAMNGEDPLEVFTRYRTRVSYIQFSNIPGRHEPGVGMLDVGNLIAGLADRGYDSWFGAEYRPTKNTCSTLAWLPHQKVAPFPAA